MIAAVVAEGPGWGDDARARLARWADGAGLPASPPAGLDRVTADLGAWRAPSAGLFAFDRAIDRGGDAPHALCLAAGCPADADAAPGLLARYQRLLPPPAGAPGDVRRSLDAHRRLFDLSKPLVKADYDHALDTWRWALRLDPGASTAVQLAALFHDVERLVSEPDRRVEHLAPDYQAFKDAHARAGAAMLRDALAGLALPAAEVERAAALVARHERPSADPELALLNDADALSFFSLNAWGYVNYFGPEQTARKVRYTLARLRPAARGLLGPLRHHPVVAAQLELELAPAGPQPRPPPA